MLPAGPPTRGKPIVEMTASTLIASVGREEGGRKQCCTHELQFSCLGACDALTLFEAIEDSFPGLDLFLFKL